MRHVETRPTAPYSAIIKPVSAECNLSCDYCYYRRVLAMYPASEPRRMPDAVLGELTRQVMQDSGQRAVFSWQGGEPLLAGREFFERAFGLQARLARPGQAVVNTVQTNGTLLDAEWAEFFAKHRVLVGLSIDGPAAAHDRYRRYPDGRGSHNNATRALALLRRAGADCNVLVVVSSANAKSGASVYRWLTEQGATWLQFIPCTERSADGNTTPESVSGPAYGQFMCDVFNLWHPRHTGLVAVREFENIAQRIAGRQPELCVFSPTCGNAVVVEYQGDVYACDHFVYEDFRLGNLMEAPLRTLVRRGPARALARAKLSPPPQCATCQFEGLCFGGCPKGRFDPVTRTFKDPVLCQGYKMLFEKAVEPIRAIVRGSAPRWSGPS